MGIFDGFGKNVGRVLGREIGAGTYGARNRAATELSHEVQIAIGTRSPSGAVSDVPNRILNNVGLGTSPQGSGGLIGFFKNLFSGGADNNAGNSQNPTQVTAKPTGQGTVRETQQSAPAAEGGNFFTKLLSAIGNGIKSIFGGGAEVVKKVADTVVTPAAAAAEAATNLTGSKPNLTNDLDNAPKNSMGLPTAEVYQQEAANNSMYMAAQINRDELKQKMAGAFDNAVNAVQNDANVVVSAIKPIGVDVNAPAANDAQYKVAINSPAYIPGR